MRRAAAIWAFSAALVATGASAEVEGRYAGRGEGALSAVIKRAARADAYAVVLKTRARNCSGEVSGEGTLAGGVMTLKAKTDEPKGCTIRIETKGKALTVDEQEGCLFFHGVSCGFSGTLSRR